jgi:hypothetical protein
LANGSNSHCNYGVAPGRNRIDGKHVFPFRELKNQFRNEIAGNPAGEPTQ